MCTRINAKLSSFLQGRPGITVVGPKGDKGEPAGVLPESFYNYEVHGPPGPKDCNCPAGPPVS